MFSKMKAKPTLVETYEEAEKVEAKKESIEDYLERSGEKMLGENICYLLSLRRSNYRISREWKK